MDNNNRLQGTHIATGIPVDVDLTRKEVLLITAPFGDINDKESQVAQLKEDSRMYHLLEHVGTKPNVMYQVKVRNTDQT